MDSEPPAPRSGYIDYIAHIARGYNFVVPGILMTAVTVVPLTDATQ